MNGYYFGMMNNGQITPRKPDSGADFTQGLVCQAFGGLWGGFGRVAASTERYFL
jgi:hypothetical protein